MYIASKNWKMLKCKEELPILRKEKIYDNEMTVVLDGWKPRAIRCTMQLH